MKTTTADRLKEIMRERNLRQVDILRMCQPYCKRFDVKLQKSDLSQYVSGKFVPSQFKLTILGLALNVSEAWLMGYDVSMSRNEKVSPTGELEEDELLLLDMYRSIPNEKKSLIMNIIRVALNDYNN